MYSEIQRNKIFIRWEMDTVFVASMKAPISIPKLKGCVFVCVMGGGGYGGTARGSLFPSSPIIFNHIFTLVPSL